MATVVLAIGFSLTACSGDGSAEREAPPSRAEAVSAQQERLAPPEPIALGPGFREPDGADPDDVCFGPGARGSKIASLQIGDLGRRTDDIFQCGNSDLGRQAANGMLRFDVADLGLPTGSRIVGFTGLLGIDEQAPDQAGARVAFRVALQGEVLCGGVAAFGAPVECGREPAVDLPTKGVAALRVDVRAGAPTGLWAGVIEPALLVRLPLGASPEPLTGAPAANPAARARAAFAEFVANPPADAEEAFITLGLSPSFYRLIGETWVAPDGREAVVCARTTPHDGHGPEGPPEGYGFRAFIRLDPAPVEVVQVWGPNYSWGADVDSSNEAVAAANDDCGSQKAGEGSGGPPGPDATTTPTAAGVLTTMEEATRRGLEIRGPSTPVAQIYASDNVQSVVAPNAIVVDTVNDPSGVNLAYLVGTVGDPQVGDLGVVRGPGQSCTAVARTHVNVILRQLSPDCSVPEAFRALAVAVASGAG